MKNMMEYDDEIDNVETFEYVSHITDTYSLELVNITPTYNINYGYDFIPEYYDEEYYDVE